MSGGRKKSWEVLVCAGLVTLTLLAAVKQLNAGSQDYTIVCGKADLNCDGFINFADYAKFADDWLKTGEYLFGDIDGDGIVDHNDLERLKENWLWPRTEIGEPDLTIGESDITFSNPNPVSGEEITVSVTVHNIGDADATEFLVYISISHSSDGIHWTLPMPWKDVTIPYIFEGSFSTIWIDAAFDIKYAQLCVQVDRDNQVQEPNEVNNLACNMLEIQL